jgi:catechol 2,3-dioxygenase-like lactoylglutathione lyase family enzyme
MRLAHVAVLAVEPDALVAFYSDVLGLTVTDRGHTRGSTEGPPIVFLSWDRSAFHHQLAVIGVAGAAPPAGRVHHIAFEVDDLPALRQAWSRVRDHPLVGGLDGPRPTAVFQGDQWSLRLRDPEGNGVEIYAPSPWDVRQPFFVPMDLSLDDGALHAWGEQQLARHDHWPRGQRPM